MKVCEFIVSTVLFLVALPFILAVVLLFVLRMISGKISDKIFRAIALIFITIIYSLVGLKDLLFKTNNIEKLNELLKTFNNKR